MKDKEKQIIEASIKLFAAKGYTSTSVQEIANEAGISKGSFYLYFKSKDALLIAIFNYYYDTIKTELSGLQDLDLTPRERFVESFTRQLEAFSDKREFIIMQAKERALPNNEEIAALMTKIRQETIEYMQNSLRDIYGKDVEEYVFIASLMIQGIVNSFMELTVINSYNGDERKIAAFLLKSMDHLVYGMIRDKEKPILSNEDYHSIYLCKSEYKHARKHAVLLKELSNAKKDLMPADPCYITLEVLEEEIQKEEPRIPVIHGMLANFKDEKAYLPLIKMLKERFPGD